MPLVANSNASKRRSWANLTAEMISAPLGDFRHTMHIGLTEDTFGLTSFLRKSENQQEPEESTSKPGLLSRTFRSSESFLLGTRGDRRANLTAEMISAPLGDFQHTMHIGLTEDSFGDMSFLSKPEDQQEPEESTSKPGLLSQTFHSSKTFFSGTRGDRRANLTAEMISAPLGDFRHTMHIGRPEDSFGETSFLSKPEDQQEPEESTSKPGLLSQTFRSKSFLLGTRGDRRANLTAEMISAPLGDIQHTMHIGRPGDSFRETSFLSKPEDQQEPEESTSKPGLLSRTFRSSKSFHSVTRGDRRANLTAEMISAPLGDFGHTMHIGRPEDSFGETSFLSKPEDQQEPEESTSKPGLLSQTFRSSKPSLSVTRGDRRANLTAEMISAPLGDFRHTMHIGRPGDSFRKTSFLSKSEDQQEPEESTSKPGLLSRTFCSSESFLLGTRGDHRANLTAEMISAPLGDFRHTMHIGRPEDSFGETSFRSKPEDQQEPEESTSKPGLLSRTFRSKSFHSVTRGGRRDPALFVKNAVSLPQLTEKEAEKNASKKMPKGLSSSPVKKVPEEPQHMSGASARGSAFIKNPYSAEKEFGDLTDLPETAPESSYGMKHAESIMPFHIDLGPSMLGDKLSIMDKDSWEQELDLGLDKPDGNGANQTSTKAEHGSLPTSNRNNKIQPTKNTIRFPEVPEDLLAGSTCENKGKKHNTETKSSYHI